jgi:drug/metabolite transporter (DMT)-like permease
MSYVSLLVAMVIWASSFVALKIAFRSYDPMVVIFGRMFVASLCFLFFLKRFRGISFQKGNLKYLLFMAMCEPCLYFIFEAKALENTTASQAGVIAAMLPLLVAVAAYVFLKEHVTRQSLTGFAIAILGSCWLSLTATATESAPNPPLGNFFEFVAMIFATGYTVTLKRLTTSYPPFLLTGIQAMIGCGFYFPFLFMPSTTLPAGLDWIPILAVVYLGSIVTLGAYGLYNFGVSQIPASQASAFVNLIPVFTIFFGWMILNEQLLLQQYVAASLVVAGVFLSQERSRHKVRHKVR